MMKRCIIISALILVFLTARALYGAEAKNPLSLEGIWEGILRMPGEISEEGGPRSPSTKYKVYFTIIKTGEGQYAATMDSPDQGAKGVSVDQVTLEDGQVFMDIKAASANFKGKLDKDGSKMKGYWQQGGNPPLSLSFKYVGKAPDTHPAEKPYTGPDTERLSSLAKGFVELLAEEDFENAVKEFDGATREKLTPEKLRDLWKAITAQAGPFKRQAGVRITEISDYFPVYVTCEFEKLSLDLKVVVSSAKQIAGLSVVQSQPAGGTAP